MITATYDKLCLTCNKPVKGRTDKKFCNDYCRNNFNNQIKATANNLVRNINNALAKNRRILESLIESGEEMAKVSKDILLQQGFQFKYNTHSHTTKKGSIYFFSYDHGYLCLDNNVCLIVKEDMNL